MILSSSPTTLQEDRWVLGLTDLDAGRIAIPALPDTRDLLPVAGQLLATLGKSTPREGFHASDCERAGIWLRAHAVAHVIVLHADLYSDQLLGEIDALVSESGATLWALVDQPMPVVRHRALLRAAEREIGWEVFRGQWDATVTRPDRQGKPPTAPQVAGRTFPTDRSATDQPRVAAFITAVNWERDDRPKLHLVETRLRDLLERFDDPSCLESAVETIAVVLEEAGWKLTVGRPVTSAVWRPGELESIATSLRRERDPRVTAACALWTMGLALDEIREVRIAGVADNFVRLKRDSLPIAAALQPLIAAQVLDRCSHGATTEELLFVGERGQLSARGTDRLVRGWVERSDPHVTGEELRLRPREDGRWLAERGISLQWIPRRDRPKPMPGVDRHADFLTRLRYAAHGSSREDQCGCRIPHPSPATTLPPWPPVRVYPPVRRDHPWAYRPSVRKAV